MVFPQCKYFYADNCVDAVDRLFSNDHLGRQHSGSYRGGRPPYGENRKYHILKAEIICFRYHFWRIVYARQTPPPHGLGKSQIWSPPLWDFLYEPLTVHTLLWIQCSPSVATQIKFQYISPLSISTGVLKNEAENQLNFFGLNPLPLPYLVRTYESLKGSFPYPIAYAISYRNRLFHIQLDLQLDMKGISNSKLNLVSQQYESSGGPFVKCEILSGSSELSYYSKDSDIQLNNNCTSNSLFNWIFNFMKLYIQFHIHLDMQSDVKCCHFICNST